MIDKQTEQAMRQWTLAQPAVSAFIASQVHDVRQRDDILQEVAITVLEQFERFDPALSFSSWAIGIARNKTRNYFRSQKKSPLLFDSETVESLAAAYDAVSSEMDESLAYLKQCRRKLDSKAKKICDLRYEEDLKPAAIAQRLGVSANSISKGLQRIRETLRQCISQKVNAGAAP